MSSENVFQKTILESYSTKILECSVPYKQFNYVLDVRIITAEYLVAMKLRSGRNYKNAVIKLYGAWESLPPESRTFIENVLRNDNPEKIYDDVRFTGKAVKRAAN
jgi:hypothetical protein